MVPLISNWTPQLEHEDSGIAGHHGEENLVQGDVPGAADEAKPPADGDEQLVEGNSTVEVVTMEITATKTEKVNGWYELSR